MYENSSEKYDVILFSMAKNRIFGTLNTRICLFVDATDMIFEYRYGQFNSPTFSTLPPQTHTSDRPIFKNSFDSENS